MQHEASHSNSPLCMHCVHVLNVYCAYAINLNTLCRYYTVMPHTLFTQFLLLYCIRFIVYLLLAAYTHYCFVNRVSQLLRTKYVCNVYTMLWPYTSTYLSRLLLTQVEQCKLFQAPVLSILIQAALQYH
jgi:hypothetical protein